MEDTKYVTWDVHSEFTKRVEDENDRQNHRIQALEEAVHEISRLTASVEKMAVSMEYMATEQKKQGDRLDEIEKKPAKHWEAVVTGILAAIVGALGTAIASGIIH